MKRADRSSLIISAPIWLLVAIVYVGPLVWTIALSFTASRTLPTAQFVGLAQYRRLWASERWLEALAHLSVYGVMFVGVSVGLGLALAILIDQRVRGEAALRAAFLFPSAASLVVTGLVWQWIMNPMLGLQHAVRAWGWSGFTFDWATRPATAIFALVIAGVWQASGIVMAILLASLRRIDPEIWSAARIDGVPTHRVYASIIVPQLIPALLSVTVLLLVAVIKVYELVVALTRGGPGTASDMPALFVMDYLFLRQNVGLACAASVVLLAIVCATAAPIHYLRLRRAAIRNGRSSA